MSNTHAPDFANISLWIDERPDTSTCATGKIKLLDESGEVIRELNVYLYDNPNKKSERSPDYYGWVKVPHNDAPAKSKGLGSKKPAKQTDDDDLPAF